MSDYAKAYKVMIKRGETLENLNAANHLALERKEITLEQFMEAARILAAELLKR